MVLKKLKIIKHTPFIWQYLNVASEEEVRIIQDTCLKHLHQHSIINERSRNSIHNHSSYNIFDIAKWHPDLISRDKITQMSKLIHEVYTRAQFSYAQENEMFQYAMSATDLRVVGCEFPHYHFRNYEVGEEYGYHVDMHKDKRLILSALLYLNHDYDGGSTQFLMDEVEVKPYRGSILVSPCGPYFIHKSFPITKGTKNIIWACYNRSS